MKRIQEILNNIIWEVNNGTNFKASVNYNCETQKDKNNLIKYIENMSLNNFCVEAFAKVYNIKKLGFKNIDELQSFIYMSMWNNIDINNL